MKKLYTLCLTIALSGIIAGGAKKFPMTAASIVPAAQGDVEVDKDKNGNTRVTIKVDHLARPENLTPPQVVYVVWLQDRGGSPENEGQLKVDKKLTATFKTVTPSKAFDLFVTGEHDYSTKAPSGPEVLRTAIQL